MVFRRLVRIVPGVAITLRAFPPGPASPSACRPRDDHSIVQRRGSRSTITSHLSPLGVESAISIANGKVLQPLTGFFLMSDYVTDIVSFKNSVIPGGCSHGQTGRTGHSK